MGLTFEKLPAFREGIHVERIEEVCFGEEPPIEVLKRISIGVVTTTRDKRGLKLVPTPEVAVFIDDKSGNGISFCLCAENARAVAKALEAYAMLCDSESFLSYPGGFSRGNSNEATGNKA